MKKYFTGLLIFMWIVGLVSSAIAAPELIMIKDAQKRTKEQTAAAQIKGINLQDIEDPAARRAIQQILNYLGLNSSGLDTQK